MTQQLLLDILPASPPTFRGFVAGANAAAVACVQSLAPGRAVYLWGGAGCGRSHLLQASTGAWPAHADQRAAHAAGTPDEGCHYLDSDTPPAWLHALATEEGRRLVRVAVDDVHRLDEAGQAALFALFNRWRTVAATPAAFALLTAGERAPRAMQLREDLRTRLGWDLVFRLAQLSDAERSAALRDRARERGVHLPEDVLQWILTHQARDMGRLTALIDLLDRYSLARHRPITLPLLKDLLADPPRPDMP